MTPADQLAHFSGGTDNLAMSGLWYSHKRVTELVQAAKEEAVAVMQSNLKALHRPFIIYEPCNHPMTGCDAGSCEELDWAGEFFHLDEPTGKACSECRDEDGDHASWPCDTARDVLGVTS